MNRCKDCKHFDQTKKPEGFGTCKRWHYGYHVELSEVQPNEVLVEDDEGWGAYMGPEFGCVLHEVAERGG